MATVSMRQPSWPRRTPVIEAPQLSSRAAQQPSHASPSFGPSGGRVQGEAKYDDSSDDDEASDASDILRRFTPGSNDGASLQNIAAASGRPFRHPSRHSIQLPPLQPPGTVQAPSGTAAAGQAAFRPCSSSTSLISKCVVVL